jgi:hypothetical protein
VALAPDGERDLTRTVRFTGVRIERPDPSRDHLLPGEPLSVRAGYQADEPNDDVVFALELHDQEGQRLLGVNTEILGTPVGTVHGAGEVTFHLGEVPLLDGTYAVSLGIHTRDGGVEYDHRDQLDRFSVLNPSRVQGKVHFRLDAEHHPR